MKASGTSSRSMLTALDAAHPEWRPLLLLIEETLREATRPQWARFVPELTHPGQDGWPLLDGAVITVTPGLIGRWVRQIVLTAAAVGTDVELLGRAMTRGQIDPVFVFATALSQDDHRLDELARSVKDGRGVLRGMAPLIARPMLQACWSAWADRVPAQWAFGYCPLCGSWPTLAEIRGLDGSRHLRCGCCGSDWRSEWLRCPFCGETDHEKLGALVLPDSLEQKIEVCDACQGYVKTVATLTPIPADHVVLQDLATLVLDVHALEHDYRRPAAKGREVAVRVVAEPSWLRDLFGRGR
jgi:FdhE protein